MVHNSISRSPANFVMSKCKDSVHCRSVLARPVSASSFVLLLLTFHAVLFSCPAEASRCSGCYNGGQLFLPTSIFGHCRCLCEGNFAGPQCEFVGKRSSDSSLGQDDDEVSAPVNALRDTRLDSKLNLLKDMWVQLRNEQDDSGSYQESSRRTRLPQAKRRLASDAWL